MDTIAEIIPTNNQYHFQGLHFVANCKPYAIKPVGTSIPRQEIQKIGLTKAYSSIVKNIAIVCSTHGVIPDSTIPRKNLKTDIPA